MLNEILRWFHKFSTFKEIPECYRFVATTTVAAACRTVSKSRRCNGGYDVNSATLQLTRIKGLWPRPLHGASSRIRSKEFGGYGGPPSISMVHKHTHTPCKQHTQQDYLCFYTVTGKNGPPKHVRITLWIKNDSHYFSLYHESHLFAMFVWNFTTTSLSIAYLRPPISRPVHCASAFT